MREYYRQHHLNVVLPGCRLRDAKGRTVGYLEDVRLKEGRLYLRGWTLAQGISFRLGRSHVLRAPQEERDDVAKAFGCRRQVGFQASLPFDEGPLLLDLDLEGQAVPILHNLKAARALRRAGWRMDLALVRDVVPLLPTILRGILREDPDLPRQVKSALRLGPKEAAATLDAGFMARSVPAQAPQHRTPPRITIILPVYNALDLLPETLARLAAHTDLPCDLIVIEDSSSDPKVRPWLRDWVARCTGPIHVELIENAQNLGFIGTVNRGFDRLRERSGSDPHAGPVILLNSDAMVPAGWASRLIQPLHDPVVASATPLSNDAEIFNAPIPCHAVTLLPGQVDHIDAVLRDQIAANAPQVCAPTGVGFCIALGRDWLDRLGGFDPAFGRGYGEEVDWCRRAAALGGKHVAVTNLFVEHRGGASFGAEKRALIQNNNALISARYPGYDRLVHDFIRSDPLITPRLQAALAWADSLDLPEGVPVFIAHSMGGGAEQYLQQQVRAAKVSVALRFGGPDRCRIELDCPSGRLTANTEDLALVVRLLSRVSRRRVLYSCAVGDPDLREIPAFLIDLAQGGAALEILFHDYLPISPSYNLLDRDGVYRGVPQPDHADPTHSYRRADGTVVPLRSWQDSWAAALQVAQRLVVFSASSARIVAEAFPAAADKIDIVPHRPAQLVPPVTPPQTGRTVIGVLGAIGPQKGAAVVSEVSRALKGRADFDLVVIGRIAPGYPLDPKVPVHGLYAIEDIPQLVARYGITHWLIPSIWPETFSYTVHECLATGLPTLAFDLGAQGDAVRAAANGIVLPWTPGLQKPADLAQSVIAKLCPPAHRAEHERS